MFVYTEDESCAPPDPFLEKEQRIAFSKVGWNYDLALVRTNALLCSHGYGEFKDSIRHVFSQHWIAFAALVDAAPRRILEIGTYTAHTTAFLAAIFPESEIITVDLQDNSPLFQTSYGRDSESARREFILERNRLLALLGNVHFVQANSILLPALGLGKFDLIWMDGGHKYPDVAWDTCNCLHSLTESGILLCDDVYINKKIPDHATKDSFHVLDVLRQENLILCNFINKRLHPWYLRNAIERKFIAVVKKIGINFPTLK